VTPSKPAADTAADVVRIALEANATVHGGPVARGGQSRGQGPAAEPACTPRATVPPVGRCLPTWPARLVYGVPAPVPRDWRVERLIQGWAAGRERFVSLTTRGSQVANGPENHRRRTPGMQRMGEGGPQYRGPVRLAYAPPSPRQDTPIEHGWGILEPHGHGPRLDALDPVLRCARPLTWHGKPPGVERVTPTDQTGGTLTQEAMEAVVAQIKRLPALEQWCVDIVPPSRAIWDT
jgi:hypothetical protein